jgi:hypothetical protein
MSPVRHHPVDADADRIMPGEVLIGGALVIPVRFAENARGEAPSSTSRFTLSSTTVSDGEIRDCSCFLCQGN